MQIKINGEVQLFSEGITLLQWLQDQGEDGNTIIVELNAQIITQEALKDVILQEGDQLEVFKFVGGG